MVARATKRSQPDDHSIQSRSGEHLHWSIDGAASLF